MSTFPVFVTYQGTMFMFCAQKSIRDVKEDFVKKKIFIRNGGHSFIKPQNHRR